MTRYLQPDTIELFDFDELTDSAKDTARAWYRDGAFDYEWWDAVYDDAKQCAELIGIDIDKIYFSGFSSPGDGACFEGSYSYKASASKAIRDHAPQDTELHRIASELQKLQRANFYRLTARVVHRGHYDYYHEMCTDVSVDDNETRRGGWLAVEEALTELLRDFMRWIYRQLETEHEYLNSDAQVDDAIRANEYTFDAEGNRAG